MTPRTHTLGPTEIWHTACIEDLGRREFMTGALGATLLIACGDGKDDESEPTSEPATKKFTDATGNTVEVPSKPQRIIALHPVQVAPLLLSVGAPVVGIATAAGPWPASLDDFDVTGIPQLGRANEVDIEQVIQLKPDLIVGYSFPHGGVAQLKPEVVERLRRIAPTVFIKVVAQPGDVMPRDVIAPLTELVGVDPNVVTAQQREYEGVVAEIRELLGPTPAGVTVRVILFFEDNNTFEFLTPGEQPDVIGLVLGAAGATWLGEPEGYETTGTVSLERLRDVAADLLITGTYRADYTDHPLYQLLEVVRTGQVIEVPELYGGATYPNYIDRARFLLERLRAMPQPLRSDLA